ncbi:nuclease [Saccharibacter sp. 17.LH.SD]|uniref:helix-turn-helix domain-containing protein n=1 Tax=Saccharibacter sp. 17.LH.SD TaxID=2689393 RepID=UPI00136FB2DB|nr:nuclease [Saccharibacter sp. 17.LH.SD]MXV43474.1 nuclease [Saccharibacter sp. 17.LH.SD]
MTPTRLRQCLDTLHWTQRGFARIVGCSEGTVRQWARGRLSVPSSIAAWLEKIADYVEKNPLPKPFSAQESEPS